jgi:hypothetical protein
MAPAIGSSLHHLSDEALIEEVKRLAEEERTAEAELIAHLAEVDARKLYLRERPRPSAPSCVRWLAMPPPRVSTAPALPSPAPILLQGRTIEASPAVSRPEPLGCGRFRVQFTASRENREKLAELQALLAATSARLERMTLEGELPPGRVRLPDDTLVSRLGTLVPCLARSP